MTDIRLEIQSHGGFIRASVFLLGGHQEDYRIEIGKIKIVCPAENHIIIQADIQPFCGVHTQVMHHGIFFRKLIIAPLMLTDQFHENTLIIQFPDTGIEFEEKIGSRIIAQEKAPVPITDKIFVVTKLHVKIFPEINIDGAPCIEIIESSSLERFEITGARNGRETGSENPVLKKRRTAFLIIRDIRGEAQVIGDEPAQAESL